jgi:glycosyltransferase involved in cell wall biosynthesis
VAPEHDRRLRVAVDAAPLLGQRTGVGHVSAGIVAGLATRDDVEVEAYVVTRRGRRDLGGVLPAGARPATSWIPARAVHHLWERWAWPTIERWTGPVDVVHATNFVAPPARAPVVVSVYDLAFARFPELCRPETARLEPLLRRALDRGATVHTVSDHVAEEVREHFGVAAERVVRIYTGIASNPNGDAMAGRRLARSDRYVLALGTVEPRKNLPTLVRAFDRMAERVPDVDLVVAGPDGWGVDAYRAAVDAARHADRIRRLGYVSDERRADLLAGAAALAYPSLYEGFGHPPLEAMAAGVPVVTARAGSLPEAVGDAALLVDPHDDGELTHALERVLSDDDLRADLVERGRRRAAVFTWPPAIDELVGLYRKLSR